MALAEFRISSAANPTKIVPPLPPVQAWGTVPQSTVDDLIALLGLNLDQTVAALGKVEDILSAANYGIYRQRHANTAAAPRAAAPREPPETP